jgi:hypothetical protein
MPLETLAYLLVGVGCYLLILRCVLALFEANHDCD